MKSGKQVVVPEHRRWLTMYRCLIRILPRRFRAEFGPALVQTFSDLLEAEYRKTGLRGVVAVWSRTVRQTAWSALSERLPRSPRAGIRGREPARVRLTDGARSVLSGAARSVTTQPGFACTVLVILGIGISATTTIFTAVNGVLFSEMPYPALDRLVNFQQGSHSPDEYLAWREIDAFEQIAALENRSRDMILGDEPTVVRTAEVTAGYFPLLGVRPHHGRLIANEDTEQSARVVVLGYSFWADRLGADPEVVGRVLQLDDSPYTIIGVAAEFDAPYRAGGLSELWTPLVVAPRQHGNLRVLARLRAGVTFDAAQSQVSTATAALVEAYPDDYRFLGGQPRSVPLVLLSRAEVEDVAVALYMALGAVGLLLVLACATVANLFLARTRDRRHEIAVRTALGASRGKVARLLLIESLTLSGLAGALGVVVAYFGVRGLVSVLPAEMPRLATIQIDWAVVAFAVGVSTATGAVFGLAPMLFTGRLGHGAARGAPSESTAKPTTWVRLRGALVSIQIAIALVLLICSGLLFHSFVNLLRVDPGFEPTRVLASEVDLGRRYPSGAARVRFARDVQRALESTAGVESVAYALLAPFSREPGCCWWGPATTSATQQTVRLHLHPVSHEYMGTLGIDIVRGSGSLEWDPSSGEAVPVIVGTSLERRMFEGGSALGQTLSIGNGGPESARIVGVIEDLKFGDLSRTGAPQAYLPYDAVAEVHDSVTFVVRFSETGTPSGGAVRSAVWSVDPLLPVPLVASLQENVDASLWGHRFASSLLLGFAGFALAIALVGTYGTMRYAVSRRRRELGIRLVLGATPGRVVRDVMRRGAAIVTVGLLMGLAGAAGLAALLDSVIFGITPWDPATYATIVLVIAATSLLACYLPARRASRLDPLATIRPE